MLERVNLAIIERGRKASVSIGRTRYAKPLFMYPEIGNHFSHAPKTRAIINPRANGGNEIPNNATSIEMLSARVYGLTAEITPINIPIKEEIINADTANNAVAGKVCIIVFSTSLFDE